MYSLFPNPSTINSLMLLFSVKSKLLSTFFSKPSMSILISVGYLSLKFALFRAFSKLITLTLTFLSSLYNGISLNELYLP